MSFELNHAAIQEWLDDDPSLNTLKNQYTVAEIYGMLENKEQITDEDALYDALLDVMYTTRPQGVT